MKLRHIGVRPEYDLEVLDYKRKIYIEEFPDGSYKLWNKKLLRSGCDKIMTELKELRECIYCSHCDEWFSKSQWKEI